MNEEIFVSAASLWHFLALVSACLAGAVLREVGREKDTYGIDFARTSTAFGGLLLITVVLFACIESALEALR